MIDGRRLVVLASEPGHTPPVIPAGHRQRGAQADFGGGVRVGHSFVGLKCISPDGGLVVALGPDRRHMMDPIEGGEPLAINGLTDRDLPVRFTADGRTLFVFSENEHAVRKLERFEIATGRRTSWPSPAADMAGVVAFFPVQMTADGKTAVYNYHRVLEDLYLVSGLR